MATLQNNVFLIAVLILCSAFVNLSAPSFGQQAPPDAWHWGPTLSQRRTAFSSCPTADAVVTVGGTFWSDLGTAGAKKRWLSSVEQFAVDTGKWEPLPAFPIEIDYALVAFVDRRLFVVGGQNSEGILSQTRYLDLGDPGLRWQEGPQLPRPLARLRGGVWNQRIVALTDEPVIDGQRSLAGSRVLVLDASVPESQWEDMGPVPEPSIGSRAAAIIAGKLFIFGGAAADAHGQLQLSPRAWNFDLGERKWSECATLSFAVRDAAARALSDEWIVIAGGVEEALSADDAPDGEARILLSTRVTLYDAKSNQFFAAQPLPMAVADHGLVVLDDQLLAVGGEDSPYRTRTDLVQSIDWRELVAAAGERQVVGSSVPLENLRHLTATRLGFEKCRRK